MKERIFIIVVWVLSMLNLPITTNAQSTEETVIGASSGYPLPRFMTLRDNTTYLRTGPGQVYPIDWIYLKQSYPLKVIAEFGDWRKVVDVDQTTGWIKKHLLTLRRKAIIIKGTQELVRSPQQPGKITVIAEEDVLGDLIQCENGWCEMELKGIEGWIKQENIWGVLKNEEFN